MGQGIFKAVFWNLTLIFTSFNEGRSFDPIFISGHWDSTSVGVGSCEGSGLLAVHLILDCWLHAWLSSTLLGSAAAPGAAGEAVVLLVLLRWRWGSLRILYSRICGSQYVSLCHSMRWMRVPHLNNYLNIKIHSKYYIQPCVLRVRRLQLRYSSPHSYLHDTHPGTRTFM